MILVNLIYGLFTGYYKQLYGITFPILWILIEATTIFILYGFHKKLYLNDAADLENNLSASRAISTANTFSASDADGSPNERSASVDVPIVYAHNPVLKKNSLEIGTET